MVISKALLDMIWILLCAGLVLLMQAGFCCLESGLVRAKNSVNVAIKNLADFCVSSCVFWIFGFAIMFGASYQGVMGTSHFFFNAVTQPWLIAFFLFQLVFCGTAITIISGAVAERMRFSGYLIVAVIVSGFIYPVIGHWVWGGAESGAATGWLARQGFIDFAGSTVVHATGGWVSLAAVLIIGPRIGRFNCENPARIHGHNLPMATLGVFLLWFGWIGFNGGSTLGVTDKIPLILVNTILAGSFGGALSIVLSRAVLGRFDVGHVMNGSLAGLVGITASCHIMVPWAAVAIGSIASLLCFSATILLEKLKIDDAVGAIPVHCCGGIWGTLAVALFASADAWGTGLDRWEQFLIQCVGVGATFLWAFGIGFCILWLVNQWFPLRVISDEEHTGLNVAEHGAHTELIDLMGEMDEQRQSGDFSSAVSVEPHTEVGQIAVQYNRVLGKFNTEKSKLEMANDEIQKANENLAIAHDEVLEASQAKSAFLANMSHELRTPLNAILGYSEILKEDAEANGQQAFIPDLHEINSAGKHLLGLINNILDLSKIEAGKIDVYLEDFEVSTMIQNVTATIKPLVEKNSNELVTQCAGDCGSMYADITKLRQVLFNLLSNACKFTKHGKITLEVIREQIDKQDWVIFKVSDSGIGIAPEHIEKLFEEFVQGDSSTTKTYGGTGLGLAISKRFCELMGGDIKVESQPGKGTTFSVQLPAKVMQSTLLMHPSVEDSQSDKVKTQFQSPVSHAKKILVIDDDLKVHELIQRTLGKEGFEVVGALTGEEGIKLAREIQPDAITLDVMMPKMDGWAVLSALKNDPMVADIPVTMVTMVDERQMGYALGAVDYLTKPLQLKQLAIILNKYCQNHQPGTVLVVEDERSVRELLVRQIEKAGWQVHEAENGRVALNHMALHMPTLILSDLMMPVMDGFQFIAELRKNKAWVSIPVVVLTAMELSEEDRARLDGHIQRILEKGACSQEVLLHEISSQMRKQIQDK